MGWSRKAKFGIHSGKTLRKWPTRKYCRNHFSVDGNGCQQFAVVKEYSQLEEQDRTNYVSRNKFEFDDGIPITGESSRPFHGRGYPQNPVIHSLNKHKRWLLPDLVREGVERRYETETNEIADPVGKGRKFLKAKSDKLRITVVERHASPYNLCYRNGNADCFSLASNCPDVKSTPVRKPTKAHAHVGDLNSKRGSEDETELYYEFLSPYPKKSWPNHRQVTCQATYDDMVGSKSKKKTKGRRNKHYRHGVAQDEPIDVMVYKTPDAVDHTTNYHDTSVKKHSSTFSFPIGACIDSAIQTKATRKNDVRVPGSKLCSRTCNTSSFHQFGKGEAIYLESDDAVSELSALLTPSEEEKHPEESLAADRKFNIQLLTESIYPNNLKQEFGDHYTEDAILPRKFIIKADLNETSPCIFTDDYCCLLFEVSDVAWRNAVAVEAQVTLSLPTNEEISAEKVSESFELELSKQYSIGPLTVKETVILLTEKVVCESSSLQKSSCVRRNPSNVAANSVNFVHDICQQKPEICLAKQAVQYSIADEAPKVLDQKMSGDEYVKATQSFECEICLLDMDQDEGVTMIFTCLLQCFHGFCNACWRRYITLCIQAGQAQILCPNFDCSTCVGAALVWSLTNSNLYHTFCKLNYQLAIATNPALRPCPAPGCVHLAYVPPAEEKTPHSIPILCHCGELWCFACQNDAHWPASCKEAEVFRKAHDDFNYLKKICAIDGRITSVHVKRCPFCSYPIDKGTGCPHMSCRCGNEFCWSCLKPWFSHGWECEGPEKDLEEVQLAVSIGNARYNKYFKVSLQNFVARSGKGLTTARKSLEKAKRLENSHKLVYDSDSSPTSRLVRSFIESSISSHVEAMFHFKYLAHFVLENTATAMAVSKRKVMLKPLDEKIQNMEFILGRMNELILEPILLTDERNLVKVKMLLKNGGSLIKSMHMLVQLNRKN